MTSIIAIIGSFYLISIATSSLQLFIAGALYGLGYAFLLPIMNAMVLSNVARTQRGSAVAVFSASLDVAFGGGAIFWGVIASFLNFSMMYKICSFLCVISGFIFLVTYAKEDRFEKLR